MSGKLAGKTAVITGASRGLGKAMALALAAEGARIALVARDRERLDAVAAEIGAANGQATVVPADVTSEDQVRRIEREIAAQFGKVDILINNAGVIARKPIAEFTLEEWRRVMDTSVTAAFLMCRSLVPHMRGRGYGRILNMTSTMSRVSLPHRAAYSASKAALLGMTRALELTQSLDPEVSAQILADIPLGRWGRVEEVGQLAVYLCSEDAGFITGTDILIDGGWCAR